MKEDGTDYYQVTRSLEDPTVLEREVRPFREVTGRGERHILTYDDVPRSQGEDAITMNVIEFLLDDGCGSAEGYDADGRTALHDTLEDYIRNCSDTSGTAVTSENFDRLSGELQECFFDLQAFLRRPGMWDDRDLQELLQRLRSNNVMIFNKMIGCVNANRGGASHRPAMAGEMSELRSISERMSECLSADRADG